MTSIFQNDFEVACSGSTSLRELLRKVNSRGVNLREGSPRDGLGTLACILHHQRYRTMAKAAGPLPQISIARVHVMFWPCECIQT